MTMLDIWKRLNGRHPVCCLGCEFKAMRGDRWECSNTQAMGSNTDAAAAVRFDKDGGFPLRPVCQFHSQGPR
jgi:hypothetical protein